MTDQNLADRTENLALSGRGQEALALLRKGAAENDAEALFVLAHWCLAGRFVVRDLARSRDFFRRSAEAGNAEAASVYRAFLANGTGGSPDWQGPLRLLKSAAPRDPQARRQLDLIKKMRLSPEGDPIAITDLRILSDSPEVKLFPSLFTEGECDFIAENAEPLFSPSVVVDPNSGRDIPNPIRTSEGAAFPLAIENPAIHALNRRMAAASGTLPAQGEPLQVLKYRPGQEYKAHFDALPGVDNQRLFTMLVYLNEEYEGGETCFLEADLRIRGRKGDALLFANSDREGRPDPRSRHAGLPVTKGMKLLASRWIRARPLDLSGSGNR